MIVETIRNAVLEAFPDPVAMLDGKGTVVAANAAWTEFVWLHEGRSDGLLGENCLRPSVSSSLPYFADHEVRKALEAILRGECEHFSRDFVAASGEMWFGLTATALSDTHAGALLTCKDKTELYRLSASLRHVEEQVMRIFLHSPAPGLIISLDDLRILQANKRFLEIVAYDSYEVVGKLVTELGFMPLVARDKWRQLPNWDEAREYHLRTRFGAWRTVLLNLETLEYRAKAVVVMTFEDVTERRNIEEQLSRAIKEVMQDSAWFSHAILEKMVHGGDKHLPEPDLSELTQREHQVLALLATGMDNKDIASRLHIASQTVRNYVSRLYSKLNVSTRAEAIVWARERGFVDS